MPDVQQAWIGLPSHLLVGSRVGFAAGELLPHAGGRAASFKGFVSSTDAPEDERNSDV
jgi:hypothetical protein